MADLLGAHTCSIPRLIWGYIYPLWLCNLLTHIQVTERNRKLNWKSLSVCFLVGKYFLIPSIRVLIQNLTAPELVDILPVPYGSRRFITAVKTAGHLPLSIYSTGPPPPNLNLLHLITLIFGEEYNKSRSPPLLHFLQLPVNSSS